MNHALALEVALALAAQKHHGAQVLVVDDAPAPDLLEALRAAAPPLPAFARPRRHRESFRQMMTRLGARA